MITGGKKNTDRKKEKERERKRKRDSGRKTYNVEERTDRCRVQKSNAREEGESGGRETEIEIDRKN